MRPEVHETPLIMGVLNVTPDSFSDGGRWLEHGEAIAHGLRLVADGADIVDVGGESTRPGAARVPAHEERRRVVPVVRELAAQGIRVSIDTMHASTALAAVEAGAEIINDVSAGLADADMASVAADTGVLYVAMHWRGHSDRMNDLAVYDDVVTDVRNELGARVASLLAAGIDAERIVLDPGLGFAKRAEHNWALLAGLRELGELGYPLLVGASRKRFVGALLPQDATMEARDLPSAVISALCAREGVWAVRAHDVTSTRVALAVARSWQSG